jgi:hypothetical protein
MLGMLAREPDEVAPEWRITRSVSARRPNDKPHLLARMPTNTCDAGPVLPLSPTGCLERKFHQAYLSKGRISMSLALSGSLSARERRELQYG